MSSLSVLWLVFVATASNGAGVTKPSGLDQFWMDDIKILDQIYGKTSDKQLYGATLPPAISFDFDLRKKIKAQESQKKERFSSINDDDFDSEEQFSPFEYGDRYAKQFIKNLKVEKAKKTAPLHFVGLKDFKPISQTSDPETYNYLKHLEDFEKHKQELSHTESELKHFKTKVEQNDAYKSIQDILDAHEANRGHKLDINSDFEPFSKHRSKDDDEEYARYAAKAVPSKSKVRFLNNNKLNSRCRGRCRKRLPGSYRSGTRPYIRKIKRYRIA